MEHALESGDSDSEDMEGGGGTSDHEHPDEHELPQDLGGMLAAPPGQRDA